MRQFKWKNLQLPFLHSVLKDVILLKRFAVEKDKEKKRKVIVKICYNIHFTVAINSGFYKSRRQHLKSMSCLINGST